MVTPDSMRSELEVLGEKIETLEGLIKADRAVKSDLNHFLNRKLAEYKNRYGKLSSDYQDLFGT
jgi:hypothetical protein